MTESLSIRKEKFLKVANEIRETQLRDKIKKDYCQRKNINLHYIDYTQNIKEELNNIIGYYANPEPS